MTNVVRATVSVIPMKEDGPGQYHGLVHPQNAPVDGGRGQWKKRQVGGHPVLAAWSILSQD